MADLATTVERWAGSAAGAQQRYTEGVQSSTVDVVARAIAAKAKLLTGFNQAVQSGRWERALGARGTAGWKAATIAKASNYSTGIAAGKDNYSKAMQTWLPIVVESGGPAEGEPFSWLAAAPFEEPVRITGRNAAPMAIGVSRDRMQRLLRTV